jgi:transcriptional regulator with XRE-family HTH domain
MNYSPRYGRFRACLREIRQEAGLTQSALAAKLRKPQTFVSKSELGERKVDFLETLDFCAACGITIAEFTQRFETTGGESFTRQKRQGPRRMDRLGRFSR